MATLEDKIAEMPVEMAECYPDDNMYYFLVKIPHFVIEKAAEKLMEYGRIIHRTIEGYLVFESERDNAFDFIRDCCKAMLSGIGGGLRILRSISDIEIMNYSMLTKRGRLEVEYIHI